MTRGTAEECALLLVIFGAGASYDSAPTHPPPGSRRARLNQHPNVEECRPPLADHLFDDRPDFRQALAEVPDCLPLIANLRHRPDGVTVEAALDEFLAEAHAYPSRHQQLLAIRYCLHVQLSRCIASWSNIHDGVTNY